MTPPQQMETMEMRRFVLPPFCVAALFSLGMGTSSAADYSINPPLRTPYVAPVVNWWGGYIGGNIGYGWADASGSVSLGGLSVSASETLDGIVGGGQIGYNWQADEWVVGFEADIQGSGQSKNTSGTLSGVTYNIDDQITYFGTIRARVGVAMNEWMPYVTGGWGYGEFKSTATFTGVGTFSATSSNGAWTVGGGVEWMFAPRWSAKLEYLYLDTGDITNDYATTLGTLSTTYRVTNNIVRVGVNYHF
jgi:outer membrane immunogenic protein